MGVYIDPSTHMKITRNFQRNHSWNHITPYEMPKKRRRKKDIISHGTCKHVSIKCGHGLTAKKKQMNSGLCADWAWDKNILKTLWAKRYNS